MANKEQLKILKQGVEIWSEWRYKNFRTQVDLTGADLHGSILIRANLIRAQLSEANLSNSNLSKADLRQNNLNGAILNEANLSEADLSRASLNGAFLCDANLVKAKLIGANLSFAHLNGANLIAADFTLAHLYGANLTDANLNETDFSGTNLSDVTFSGNNVRKALVGATKFDNLDLRKVIGLEDVIHRGPSSISTDTFIRSEGNIPEVFLRGCGLMDWEIEMVKLYNPVLSNEERNKVLYKVYDLQASRAIQISPLFISYSHADTLFVEKVEARLNKMGVRFWRDIHHATAGRLEKQIDRAIRHNPTVLLVLSAESIQSDWVEHEVRLARGLEKEIGRDVLCPVALDDSWKSSPWPKRVMEQVMEYKILDFSEWQDDVKFEGMFRRLIDGLELFYKG